MRKIGQARNTLMDMRLSQVSNASSPASFIIHPPYSAGVILINRIYMFSDAYVPTFFLF